MIDLPVHLRIASTPREPAAALIRGNTSELWLRELSAWPGDPLRLRLYIVPASLRDRSPAGLLVVPTDGSLPPPTSRLQHYACLADSLYLPVNSQLAAAIRPEELHQLLVWPVSLLHPTIGLVGFDDRDAIDIASLIEPPKQRDTLWNGANPGLPQAPPLHSVQLLPASAQELLMEGRDEIASRDPGMLPADPAAGTDEQGFADKIQYSVLKALAALRRKEPASADAGPSNQAAAERSGLWQWVNDRLAELDNLRQREVDRLLNLMERNPDEALKYAVPLANPYQYRGQAKPTGTLRSQEIDFNLAHLGGGQATDAWQVDQAAYRRLRDHYLAATRRELNLRRYRRAAFIFAHLLGDYHAAANALEQGGHYQEAAMLYRDHLHRPLAAAACLQKCGLYEQAAKIYVDEQHFEQAGDLYMKLDEGERATACYRHAVAALISSRLDYIGAARILHDKLQCPDEALTTLLSAWPEANQGERCLQLWFERQGTNGRHDLASSQLRHLAAQPLTDRQLGSFAAVLCELIHSYPQPAFRELAGDTGRILIAGRLQTTTNRTFSRQLLDQLARCAPDDKLLGRDCIRFAASQPVVPLIAANAESAERLQQPRRVLTPFGETLRECLTATTCHQGFLALASLDHGLQLIRGNWDGFLQSNTWHDVHSLRAIGLTVGGPIGGDGHAVETAIVFSQLTSRVPLRNLPPNNDFELELQVGAPSWLPENTVSLCGNDDGGFLVLQRQQHGFVLCEYNHRGQLLVTRAFDFGDRSVNEAAAMPFLASWRDHAYLCWGNRLWWLRPGTLSNRRLELPDRARLFAACRTLAYPQMAIATTSTCLLYWPDIDTDDYRERTIEDLAPTAIGFLENGDLVICEEALAHLYRLRHGDYTLDCDFALPGTGIAVLPMDRGATFAVLTRCGRLVQCHAR